MEPFKLRATLSGHSSDVRAVLLPDPSFAITASRDGTTRIWKQTSSSPPTYDVTESSHGGQFKTCLAYLQPTKEYPDGLILSSGQDAIIEARQPETTVERNADGLLIGHSHQVCSLDVNSDAGYVVSGSWDKTARLWQVGKWESEVELQGHTASVWAVVAYDRDTIVTGCADRAIRVFDIRGKLRISFDGKDIVRALAKLPDGHPSGGQIVSASNDGVIRIWTLEGELISELFGHEAFIYSLTVLPSGEIVSSGEDRTVRVWLDTECVQVITLPAISVWSVSAGPNGDIITGSSDKMARIFSRIPERQADVTAIAEFEESLRTSAVPKEQVGPLNKTDLPGPEFLQRKAGTKEGQSQIIREADGTATLYQWSMQTQQWIKIGEVVDSAGSSTTKQHHGGKEYDYVFDIDIEDGKPPLKLPYNVTQNPYEVATKFLQQNELPISYLDETANFIIKNTQGTSLGSSQPSGPDPWGTENRYRPGEVPKSSYQPRTTKSSKTILPHKDYLSITVGKPSAAFRQLTKVSSEYTSTGNSEHSLTSEQLKNLDSLSQQLEAYNFAGPPSLQTSALIVTSISTLLRAGTRWQPPSYRLAALDLLRFLAAALREFPTALVPPADESTDAVKTIIADDVAFNANFVKSNNKLAMISIRLFVNLLYASDGGRKIVQDNLDDLLKSISPTSKSAKNDVSLAVALSTLYLNLAVLITTTSDASQRQTMDWSLSLIEQLVDLVISFPAVDHKAGSNANPLAQTSEPAYRGVMALGTLIVGFQGRDDTIGAAAKEVFDVPKLVDHMRDKGWLSEPRFQNAVAEIAAALD